MKQKKSIFARLVVGGEVAVEVDEKWKAISVGGLRLCLNTWWCEMEEQCSK